MIGIVAVAHVEPGDIHAGRDQFDQTLWGSRRQGPSVHTILALRTS